MIEYLENIGNELSNQKGLVPAAKKAKTGMEREMFSA